MLKRILKIIAGILLGILLLIICGYNLLVLYQIKGIPKISPTNGGEHSLQIKEIVWTCNFGNKPILNMRKYPFWKWVYINFTQPHESNKPSDFRAANFVGKELLRRFSSGAPTRNLGYGMKMAFTAVWISENWSADQTMEFILDSNFWGHGFYGINKASQGYFGVESKDLSKEEAVVLAKMMKAPSQYDPWCEPEKTKRMSIEWMKRSEKDGVTGLKKDSTKIWARLRPYERSLCQE